MLNRLDPRTRIVLGLAAMGAVFIAREPRSLVVEWVLLMISLPLMRMARRWIHSLRFVLPMVGLVFAITLLSFDFQVALVLSMRLLNLLTVSLIFFGVVSPEEMGDVLVNIGIPYGFAFILITGMRYVPLIGQKIRNIMDAQLSRGIDLRPRLKNATNFMALLVPLLVQSFVLSEDLAIAMESRGFGRKGRSARREYRFASWEYFLMVVSLLLLGGFAWWERW